MNIAQELSDTQARAVKERTLSGSFAVCLDFFTGPMDLLLHLVHQQEVPIEQVEMAVVCEQYLEIISEAKLLDLEKASEYLVIAATLVALKSQSVLPSAVETDDSEEELYYDTRFFEDLRARIKAFELTKRRAESLMSLPQLDVDVFRRRDHKNMRALSAEVFEQADPGILCRSFASLMKRIGQSLAIYRVRLEPISVVSFMMKIIDRLSAINLEAGQERVGYLELMRSIFVKRARVQGTKGNGAEIDHSARGAVIGSFVAILELIRRGVLRASGSGDVRNIEFSLNLSVPGGLAEEVLAEAEPFDAETAVKRNDEKVVRISEYLDRQAADGLQRERKEANRG